MYSNATVTEETAHRLTRQPAPEYLVHRILRLPEPGPEQHPDNSRYLSYTRSLHVEPVYPTRGNSPGPYHISRYHCTWLYGCTYRYIMRVHARARHISTVFYGTNVEIARMATMVVALNSMGNLLTQPVCLANPL